MNGSNGLHKRSLTLLKEPLSQANGEERPVVIEVQGITKTFPITNRIRAMWTRERKTVLKDVTLQVRRNEIFGLLGPNGAGKSTLIKILCTLVRPNAGTASVEGFDVMEQSVQVRQRIGLVNCDDRSYYWRLSARENLRFYAALANVPRDRVEQRIDELLELTNLTKHVDTRLSEFSSGMKQRLAIARGLLSDPDILFMDEPSRSLDPIGAYDLRVFIRDEIVGRNGRTVVLATNIMDEAEFLCDRMALINEGKIHAMGTTEELSRTLTKENHFKLTLRNMSVEQVALLDHSPYVTRLLTEPHKDGAVVAHLYTHHESPGLPLAIESIVKMGGEIWACDAIAISLDEVFRTVLRKSPNSMPPPASVQVDEPENVVVDEGAPQ
jgi:ABC-2 type transport system ATP-binding protein